MAKQIFYVVSCDEWDSRASERLIFLTTSETKLCRFLKRGIEHGEWCYASEEISEKEQAKRFSEDWKSETPDFIRANLLYVRYSYAQDGEEI